MESFGPYRILKKLGSGGYCDIFQVERDSQRFALKRPRPHLKYDSQFNETLDNEAKILALLRGEGHFPQLEESGELEDFHYLVMEFLDGVNLQQAIESSRATHRATSSDIACQIVLEICKGLERLHVLGESSSPLIHGDLKPNNVMVTLDGKVKLLDLGLKGGTFNYKPIERLHDNIVSPYSDIFATGQILYELLVGSPLFQGKTKLEAYFEMRDLRIDQKLAEQSLPAEIQPLLLKSLNQNPDVHYRTAAQFKEETEATLKSFKSNLRPLKEWVQEINDQDSKNRTAS